MIVVIMKLIILIKIITKKKYLQSFQIIILTIKSFINIKLNKFGLCLLLILEVPMFCEINKCENNGACLIEENSLYNQSYTCICNSTFYGSHCQYS